MMATTPREPVLPLELGGISDERREQLELRRRREMARLQESRSGTGNFRWSPIAMIPAHLCVLIFLVFLLEKLEGSLDWPWAAVLSPLWITDALFIVIKVGAERQTGRQAFKSCFAGGQSVNVLVVQILNCCAYDEWMILLCTMYERTHHFLSFFELFDSEREQFLSPKCWSTQQWFTHTALVV